MHSKKNILAFISWGLICCSIFFSSSNAIGSNAGIRYNSMNINELKAAAKKEGKVVVYSFTSRIVEVERSFEKAYPGIDLIHFDIESSRMIKQIADEQIKGIFTSDVAYMSDPPIVHKELLQKKYIENYIPPTFENRVSDAYKSPLLSNRLSTKVLLYNEDTYPNGSPVSNLWELTLPKWRGKVMIVDPFERGDYMDLLTEIAIQSDMMAIAYKKLFGKDIEFMAGNQSAGEQWIMDLFLNGLILEKNSDDINRSIGRKGQTVPPVGFGSYSDRKDNKKKGWALQIANDVSPMAGIAFPASLAIVRHAPHPAAARLLIYFMMGDSSPDGGPAFAPFYVPGDYTTRTDLIPHPDAIPLEKLRAWQIDPKKTLLMREKIAGLVLRLKSGIFSEKR